MAVNPLRSEDGESVRPFLIGCLMAFLSMAAYAAEQTPPKGVVKPQFFDKQGIKVLGYQKGPGGLNVWQVERNGVRTTFYTTPDNKALISGVVWDAVTGANLSDALIPNVAQAASDGGVPEAIKGIDTLVGVKEGKGSMEKTLYIIFDPRCPHCHAVFRKTRQYVAQGGTIKWIPVTVLGQSTEGARLVADVLQSPNPIQALGAIVAGKRNGERQPSAATSRAIAENEAYFFAAFDRNKSAGTAGVPVAFFMTKDGSPQMVSGVDDDLLLQQIFTDIRK